MSYKIDYLLKFVSNQTMNNIKLKKSHYILSNLEDNYRDVSLNILYLIKYGISNIDHVVYEMLDDLVCLHSEFILKIKKFEDKLGKEGTIRMLENL